MLPQMNPRVRTEFIRSIHDNHLKYPTELRFKCDFFFFSLKINKKRKTLGFFPSELCSRPREPGRGIRAATSPAPNVTAAGARCSVPAWGQLKGGVWGQGGLEGMLWGDLRGGHGDTWGPWGCVRAVGTHGGCGGFPWIHAGRGDLRGDL